MNIALVTILPPDAPGLGTFTEVRDAFHYALLALGHRSARTNNELLPGACNIVFGSHLLDPAVVLPSDAVLVNLEQLHNNPHLPPSYLERLKKHRVWDYSEQNIGALHSMEVRDATHVPIGHVPELARIRPAARQDVDVLFYGSMNSRRDAILGRLAASGAYVERLFEVYGAARDEWIARSKMVLNIKYYENNTFEAVRVSYLLSNSVFVVTELASHGQEWRRFDGGVAVAGYDRLVETCLEYLDQPAKREAVASKGFELMQRYDQKDYLQPALEKLQRA